MPDSFIVLVVAVFMIFLPTYSHAQATVAYSKDDSLKAKGYFNKSWNYSMGSVMHQLYLDSALQLIPTHAYYWQQKSMPLYKANKFEVGRPFLDSAVKYDRERWLEYRGFMKCIYEKNYRECLRDFYYTKQLFGNRVVMDHPYNFYIALCHLQLNNLDSSEWYFHSCIISDIENMGPKWVHPLNHFYMGITYMAKEDYQKAITCLDKTLNSYTNFSDAYYYKALCLMETNDLKGALAAIEAANTNFNQGYTFNEDNALHQDYPYQVRKAYIASTLEWIRKEAAKAK